MPDALKVIDKLSELKGDVLVSGPADAELLTYEAATSKWKNKSAASHSHDGTYLALDCSNDPLTGNLDLGVHSLTVNSIEAIGADGEVNKAAVEDSGNWDAAYAHSIDNSQAHSDYLLNTTDQFDGVLTIEAGNAVGLKVWTERTACAWPIGIFNICVRATTNMSDGFGAAFSFVIQDDTSAEEVIGSIACRRAGADDSGRITVTPYGAGSPVNVLTADGATGNVGIGTGTDAGVSRLEVRTTTTIGCQALTIDQKDDDQPFIDFQGRSAASTAYNITTLTGASVVGYVLGEVNGAPQWFPFCDAPSVP